MRVSRLSRLSRLVRLDSTKLDSTRLGSTRLGSTRLSRRRVVPSYLRTFEHRYDNGSALAAMLEGKALFPNSEAMLDTAVARGVLPRASDNRSAFGFARRELILLRFELAERSSISELLDALRFGALGGSVGATDTSKIDVSRVEAAIASVDARATRVARFGLDDADASDNVVDDTTPAAATPASSEKVATLVRAARMIETVRRAIVVDDWASASATVREFANAYELHPAVIEEVRCITVVS